jgi:hypothetical protein
VVRSEFSFGVWFIGPLLRLGAHCCEEHRVALSTFSGGVFGLGRPPNTGAYCCQEERVVPPLAAGPPQVVRQGLEPAQGDLSWNVLIGKCLGLMESARD